MCHFSRVDPGYSTQGALQDALEHIVRIFSVLLGGQIIMTTPTQAHHERVLKVLNEDGERPPSWLGHILLCRCYLTITWIYQSFANHARSLCFIQTIVMFFLCFLQADQGLQLPHDQGAGVQGWKGQGPS